MARSARRWPPRPTPGAAAPSWTGRSTWPAAPATTRRSNPSCRSPPSWTASMAGEPLLRVLMTADTVGGVWTYAAELARELGRRGVAVDLATMGAPVAAHQRAEL